MRVHSSDTSTIIRVIRESSPDSIINEALGLPPLAPAPTSSLVLGSYISANSIPLTELKLPSAHAEIKLG